MDEFSQVRGGLVEDEDEGGAVEGVGSEVELRTRKEEDEGREREVSERKKTKSTNPLNDVR